MFAHKSFQRCNIVSSNKVFVPQSLSKNYSTYVRHKCGIWHPSIQQTKYKNNNVLMISKNTGIRSLRSLLPENAKSKEHLHKGDSYLKSMFEGNAEWAQQNVTSEYQSDLKIKPHPEATIVSCCDNRVPIQIIGKELTRDAFAIRNIGLFVFFVCVFFFGCVVRWMCILKKCAISQFYQTLLFFYFVCACSVFGIW